MKKILVPCDFSAVARHAYRFAVELAAIRRGKVVVLKALELPDLSVSGMSGQPLSLVDPVAMLDEWTENATREFEAIKQGAGAPPVNVSFRVENGSVTDAVLKLIPEEKIDLIVMGTNGSEGLRAFFTGSKTERIVRTSPVPVIALHKPFHLDQVRNIIFPASLDFTRDTILLKKLKEFRRLFNAAIHILNVNDYSRSLMSDKEVKAKLEDFARSNKLEDYTVHVSHSANIEKGIVSYASRISYSIIAMATHGSKGLTRLLMGSIAEDIVNEVSKPVLTYVIPEE